MEIKEGQTWKIRILTRPDVEVARYDVHSNTVYWKYVDSPSIFEMKKDSFLRDFEIKK